jgi:hypothetical protein
VRRVYARCAAFLLRCLSENPSELCPASCVSPSARRRAVAPWLLRGASQGGTAPCCCT